MLYIDDRFPTIEDFVRLMDTGNSRFWKGTYLYVVEQEMIADRYYWLYLQYDNANLYAPHVVDIVDDAVKDNPRPKNQVEMRNQLFACYDMQSGSLYISDYQKKAAITYYMEDTLQHTVKAKYIFSSIDEFLGRVTSLKSVSFTQKNNLYLHGCTVISYRTGKGYTLAYHFPAWSDRFDIRCQGNGVRSGIVCDFCADVRCDIVYFQILR